MKFSIRTATLEDVGALQKLITISARGLGRADYSEEQIEAALRGAWGVDTQLIRDGTYFVVKEDQVLAGCGGWSRRKTMFGSDARMGRESELLNPEMDAARIRAFFVHPDFARCGIGRWMLEHCEAGAKAEGFHSAELVATLPGEKLYRRFGYAEVERFHHSLGSDAPAIEFVRMQKPRL